MKVPSTRFDVRRYGERVERHAHAHHQIVLPLGDASSGRLEMEIGDTANDVGGTRAAIVSSGRMHAFQAAGTPMDTPFLVVDLPTASMLGRLDDGHFWSVAAEIPFIDFDPTLAGLTNFIAANVDSVGFGGIRAEVAGDLVVEALARGAGLSAEPLARPLARAIHFIDRHYADAITVAAIAREAGLSESRLHALFHQRFAISPKRYVARRRLQKAAALLEGTPLSIAEVALAVGYGDQSAFARAFQRETDKTPAEYRRLRRT